MPVGKHLARLDAFLLLRASIATAAGIALLVPLACGGTSENGTSGTDPGGGSVGAASSGEGGLGAQGSGAQGAGGQGTGGQPAGGSDATAGLGGSAAGGAGEAGSGGDIDCSKTPCGGGEICQPYAGGCESTVGRCLPPSAVGCVSGRVCGCDGAIHESYCDALGAGTKPTDLSRCEPPNDAVECLDKYCDLETEACQMNEETTCAAGQCFPDCPGQTTATYSVCVPRPERCEDVDQEQCSCAEKDGGVTIECRTGCVLQ